MNYKSPKRRPIVFLEKGLFISKHSLIVLFQILVSLQTWDRGKGQEKVRIDNSSLICGSPSCLALAISMFRLFLHKASSDLYGTPAVLVLRALP